MEDNIRDLLDPAVNGVLNILNEAAKVPTIKRVVITASFACIYDATKGILLNFLKVFNYLTYFCLVQPLVPCTQRRITIPSHMKQQ